MYKINQNFRRLLKFKIYHTNRYYSICNDSFNEQILTILNNKFDNNKLSHSLLVQASDAIDAGNGVKLVGNDVDINQVISLYPGAYFPPPPVWTLMSSDGESLAIKSANQFVKKLHNYGNYDKKNEYQMNCNTFGGYIDGYYHINKLISNPYCVGHLINHPPKGTKPNVMKKEFLWKNIFHNNNNNNYEYLRSLVKDINYVGEGLWYIDPIDYSPVPLSNYSNDLMVGIAIISLRKINKNEELYINYNYHKSDYPSWYHPVVDE